MTESPLPAFEVAVIGGGPAGLSAALWLGRYLRRVALLDTDDPRNWETRGINGILGMPGIRPAELRELGRAECAAVGVTVHHACVDTITRRDDETFEIAANGNPCLTAQRLLLAFGIKDVWPDIPGLDRCYGTTAHVCPDCDGYEARDQKVIILGAGRKAVGMALALTTWTTDITICTNGAPAEMEPMDAAKLKQNEIEIIRTPITRIRSEHGIISRIELDDDTTFDCAHLFFTIAQYPADDLAVHVGCERDSIGRIVVNEHFHTSVRHVYAAGDIIHGPQLAVAAMAGGAIAAAAIHHSLLPPERRLD